jgi:hypothetical protein
MDEQPKGTILSGYRILDLTDEKGILSLRLFKNQKELAQSQGK